MAALGHDFCVKSLFNMTPKMSPAVRAIFLTIVCPSSFEELQCLRTNQHVLQIVLLNF